MATRQEDRISSLSQRLLQRQMESGGFAYFASRQESIEATCLSTLALSGLSLVTCARAIDFLLKSQLADGGWPGFPGDSESSWTTALVLSTAITNGYISNPCDRALAWLLSVRGKEGHWFWRWKFKTTDRNVRFDPDKYGWPWCADSCSWVIPTAFSVVALKQFTVCHRTAPSEKRIRLGVDMLLDRACIGGGWNAGNNVVYGVPLKPHVEATAIALLALQDEPQHGTIQRSLEWIIGEAKAVESISSLAWSILTLFVYRLRIDNLKSRLATMVDKGAIIENNATLATAILALRAGEMIHPFMVLR